MENNLEIDEFDQGFESNDEAQTTTPAAEVLGETTDKPAPTAQEHQAAPKYARITEDELKDLRAKATAIDEIKADNKRQFDSAFGKLGGMQQVLDRLQSSTQAGQQIEVSEEDFDELRAEFPELAALHVKGLNKALSRTRGTGAALDETKFDQLFQQRLSPVLENTQVQIELAVGSTLLARDHRDWREVVGKLGDKNEFRTWLDTQTPEYRQQINVTRDPSTVGEALTKFKEAKEAGKKQATNTRQRQLEAAITPRGTGGHAPGPTEEDEFDAGFRS
jgi:hypothetical protein